MEKKILLIFLVGMFLIGFTTSGVKITTEKNNDNQQLDFEIKPVMKLDFEDLEKRKIDYNNAQKAYIDPSLKSEIATTESYSILHLLDYVPDERDQGWCGNCWAWPATGALAIALNVQEGIFNRLSVQYINSCGEIVGVGCCEGGNLDVFCRFYRKTDMAIPWSNDNAHWIDKRAQCRTPCSSISTEPNYPISSIWPKTVETHKIPEAEAIENIKNQLHQEKGVYFSWILPDMDYRQDFSGFWSDEDEEEIYNLDWDCGAEYLEDEGGGHGVLCVGYNDDEGTDNDYWIMLNSWGTTSKRPNDLFAVNMHMDYDCLIVYEGHDYYSFDFEIIDVNFNKDEEAPDTPTIQGPNNGEPNTEYTFQISTIDNQGHNVYYFIDWDDGTDSGWLGPYESGEVIEASHTWTKKQEYSIMVKAKDINDAESLWATHKMSLPKIKIIKCPLLDFLQQSSILYKILQRLIQA